MTDKLLVVFVIVATFLIGICISFTIFYGVDMNSPESTVEYHKVVSVMDDGRYLIESPDGELYIDGDLQDVEPGDYMMIKSKTKGSPLMVTFYIFLGIFSFVSLFELLMLVEV